MSMIAAGVVLGAALLDRLVGEPPERVHPVALFGRLVAPLDGEWRYPRAVGTAGAVFLPLCVAAVVTLAVGAAGVVHPLGGGIVATVTLFSVTSLRLLCSTASTVIERSETDLRRAREELLALAGRDATTLSAAEVRSAAVESSAENLADGLVAPLFAFGVVASLVAGRVDPPVALALATAAAAWVKAVNTMDSMVGYRSKPVGTASSRLDDVVMWVPSRLTAVVLSVAALSPDPVVSARRWARKPPSPNSGWPMATLAAALQVRLEKPGVYILNEIASLPTVEEGQRGVALVRRAGWLSFGLTAVIVVG